MIGSRKSCAYWRRGVVEGACLRQAPRVFCDERSGEVFTRSPLTQPEDWCGDFEQRAAKPSLHVVGAEPDA